MAWTEAARKAAAEARRRKAKTHGAPAYFGSSRGQKVWGMHAFSVKGSKGAAHQIRFTGKYSEAKKKAMDLARRVAARRRKMVYVDHLS